MQQETQKTPDESALNAGFETTIAAGETIEPMDWMP